MASAKFEGGKCKGGTHAKALFMHDEQEQRLLHEHTNEHIDKSKTHLNTSAYGLSYEEICKKYDKRIAELDATTNKNRRKDRVTMQCIEIPVPKDLPHEQHQVFFDNVKEILCDIYGEKNLIEALYHFDEEHEYIDPETGQKEMSRNHGHYNFIPEHAGQLNGKWFSSRANMKKVNREIHKMCQLEFDIKFMDGSKKKGKKSVEQLKNESKEAELIQQMQGNLERKETLLRSQASQYLADKEEWRKEVIKAEIELAQQQYNQDSVAYMQQEQEKAFKADREEIYYQICDMNAYEKAIDDYYAETIGKVEKYGNNTRASRLASFMRGYKVQGKDLYQIFQEEEPRIIAIEKQNEALIREKIDNELTRIRSCEQSRSRLERDYGYDR